MAETTLSCSHCTEHRIRVAATISGQLSALASYLEQENGPHQAAYATKVLTVITELPESLATMFEPHSLTALRSDLTAATRNLERQEFQLAATRLKAVAARWK